ncbi:MAG: dihydroneopterin triphosphate diphosphatase [Pseudomonadota bacterium]
MRRPVFPPTKKFKRPESVLVVVHTRTGKVLLLKRADDPDFWQSVTGSLLLEETEPRQAAARELREETGLEAIEDLRNLQLTYRYPILPKWRPRYAPEVRENTEHAFALELPAEILITVNPAEHADYGWFIFDEAAGKVASWTNREVILKLKPKG